jgi:hypothetical protein
MSERSSISNGIKVADRLTRFHKVKRRRFGSTFFLLLGLSAFNGVCVPVADHVETHEVGGAGLGAGASDDADDLTLMDVALSFEDVFCHLDEFVGVVEAIAEDGVGAPEKHAAVDDVLEWREGEDGWVRVVLGEKAYGGAGLGEDGDGGYVKVVGGVGHALADGFGDGESDAGMMA